LRGRKFDVIVAGEVIEHLQDLRGFLQSCKRQMGKDSRVLITAPNVFNIDNILVLLVKRLLPRMAHPAWFDEHVPGNLLEWNGLRIEKVLYVNKTKFPATRYLRYKTLVVVASVA
jgi:2-polyprenyl-3-methyl-5-hydroxy-6-metoxy-1,4-benzoquinol methylase